MDEARLESWYETGAMVRANTWLKDWDRNNPEKSKSQELITGLLIEDRCPQCGARTWLNANGNQWCWNCNWDGFLYYFNNIKGE
jgi:hypothetical protein